MAQVSQFGLLGSRRFLPFFVTQFLAAFNDNLYKNALQILIAFPIAVGEEKVIEWMTASVKPRTA